MGDLHFHILDVKDRDEIVVSEDETTKVVEYESGQEDYSDMEELARGGKSAYRGPNPAARIVVHLFGSTADGTPVRVDCKGFEPFFYVRVDNEERAAAAVGAVRSYLRKLVGDTLVKTMKLELVRRRLLYGYTGGREFPFVRIAVPSLALFREVKRGFLNDKSEPCLKLPKELGLPFRPGFAPKVYEANLDPYLRFLHLRNLSPCDWCTVKGGMAQADTSTGTIVLDDCDWEDIMPCKQPPAPTAPFKVASWDIECWSATGEFPVATNDSDAIIQIGTVLTKLGSKENEKHVFVLDTCEAVPGVVVHSFKTEAALLKAWFRWIVKQDVDILIGYNIFGFDEQYVWQRCEKLKLAVKSGRNWNSIEEVCMMNRLSDYDGEMRLDEKRLSSSAMGDNFLHLWNTTGRLRIDLYHAIKRQYPMGSYKLDDTSRAFLNDKVTACEAGDDDKGWRITTTAAAIAKQGAQVGRALVLLNGNGESLCEKVAILAVEDGVIVIETPIDVDEEDVVKWAIVKDDLSPQEMFKKQKGSAADRAIIAGYCVQDCQLVLDMFRKLDTFNNAASMANVCSVPVAHIFLRGQGIKIESLIFKYCNENGLAVEVLPSPGFGGSGGGSGEDGAAAESYEGAIVLDPVPGLYTVPVGVADFASLYPSTIISENISHDTLVCVKDYDLEGNLRGISWGAEFQQYNQPDKVPFTDISFDIWGADPQDTRKHPEKIRTGIRVCRYAQDKQGAIPIIIAQLLDARKRTRGLIKGETDPFKQALLDAQQNAYKITANSLYGQLGSGTFKIRMQNLAASTTAYGRKQILFAKDAIEEFYGPASGNPRSACKIVYGDTDSLFIAFHPKDPATGKPLEGREALVETIALTEEAGKLVSQALKPPHDFEFDKVYWPFLIFSKKRYVGHKYEEGPDHYVQTSMGIALKRRDYAQIVKKVYGGAIHILLTEKDVAKAAEFVKTSCKELMDGKYGLGPLTITKSLRAEYADPTKIAHKVLADRIAVRSPGNAPAAGDRIGYVYVQPAPGQQAADLQGERIETPAYIKEKGLKPDYMYYIDHQICNPVCQVFGLLLEQVPGYVPRAWSADPAKEQKERESVAYDLLFRDAVAANNNSAKRNFIQQMFGAPAVPAAARNQVAGRVATVTAIRRPAAAKQQSSLDSFFADTIRIDARKASMQKKKEEEKEKEKAKDTGKEAGKKKKVAPQ